MAKKVNIKTLIKEAEKGDLDAIYALGQAYWDGEGIKKKKTEAISWWDQGARSGSSACAVKLAGMYEKGLIVKQDYNRAREYYMMAAYHDDPLGLYKMGYYYEFGYGIYKSLDEAMQYYEKAAALNQPDAIKRLQNR